MAGKYTDIYTKLTKKSQFFARPDCSKFHDSVKNSCTNLFMNEHSRWQFAQHRTLTLFSREWNLMRIFESIQQQQQQQYPMIFEHIRNANEPCLKFESNTFFSFPSSNSCVTTILYFYFQTKTYTRPKSVSLWTVADVQKWYKRHCDDYPMYSELFVQVHSLINSNNSHLVKMTRHPSRFFSFSFCWFPIFVLCILSARNNWPSIVTTQR